MRRLIAALAVTLTAPAFGVALQSTANAQATPADPAAALERRLADGRGVEFSEVTTDTIKPSPGHQAKGGRKIVSQSRGVAEFGGGKVVATDLTDRSSTKPGSSMRWMSFGDRTYAAGWLFSPLPAGKSWVLLEGGAGPTLTSGRIELDHPATLKAVLATASAKSAGGTYDGTRTTLYQGKITFGELRKAFPEFRLESGEQPTAEHLKIKVSWRLWLGEDRLVRRAWSSWTEPLTKGVDSDVLHVNDIRLTGWGTPVHVVPPLDDQVTTSDDLAPHYEVNRATDS
ncbi:hypothetical protein [Streptosporangium sp. NPDC000396]|uniref:hypothetical protein n=1 Tax=Streptosporangium sp. NPDC000396 TaxID=3366185 RepID=UPI0036AFF7BC